MDFTNSRHLRSGGGAEALRERKSLHLSKRNRAGLFSAFVKVQAYPKEREQLISSGICKKSGMRARDTKERGETPRLPWSKLLKRFRQLSICLLAQRLFILLQSEIHRYGGDDRNGMPVQ